MKLLNITDSAVNQKELEFLIPKDAFEAEVEKAYKKRVVKMDVPGFRKGKAPRSFIEKMYGKNVFFEDALNAILPTAYGDAEKEAKIDAVGSPEFDVKKIDEEGVVMTAKVFVKPDLTLKEYKGLQAEREEVEITGEAVDNEIGRTRERNARSIEVNDRAAQTGDEVTFDFDGYVDGVQFEGGKAEKYNLKLGSGQFIPGFEDQIVGKNIGDAFDVNVTFPENYQEETLKGKPAVFKCKLHTIKFSELPNLDDEFAKDVSEFNTLDEYKASVKAKLEDSAKKAEDSKVDEQLMSKLVENLEGEIPEVMFENEVEASLRDYENRLRYQGLDLNQYMKYTKKTIDDLKKDFRPQAERHVKTRLALEKVAKLENMTATDEDIETEYKKIAEAYNVELEKVKSSVDSRAIAEDVVVGKAALFVRDNAKVETKTDKKAE